MQKIIPHIWFNTEAKEATAFYAISFVVPCDTQEEIDYYSDRLSAYPESEQCGWVKDKYGVSWQITPRIMDEMIASDNKEGMKRVTEAFLKMKRFNIAEI